MNMKIGLGVEIIHLLKIHNKLLKAGEGALKIKSSLQYSEIGK
jgi:hypothetical protein